MTIAASTGATAGGATMTGAGITPAGTTGAGTTRAGTTGTGTTRAGTSGAGITRAATTVTSRAGIAGTALLLALVALLAASAPARAAGWSVSDVQAGSAPVLAVSPRGEAALGSTLAASHRGTVTTEINLAAPGRAFTSTPYTLSAKQVGGSGYGLRSLGLSSTGYLAASFENASDGIVTAVAPPPPSRFAAPQRVLPAFGAGGQAAADATLQWLPTATGELAGLGVSYAGAIYTPTIAAHGGHLTNARAGKPLSVSDNAAEATDGAGDTFLAGDGYGAGGCTSVAYRPVLGHFSVTYTVPSCDLNAPDSFDAITAGGKGYAALMTENLNESGIAASPLNIQVGRDGHFGAPVSLTAELGQYPVGLASDADGVVTAEWVGCAQGFVSDGVLETRKCNLEAATGSFTHGFSTPTTSLTSSSGLSQIITVDRAIAVEHCMSASGPASTGTTSPTSPTTTTTTPTGATSTSSSPTGTTTTGRTTTTGTTTTGTTTTGTTTTGTTTVGTRAKRNTSATPLGCGVEAFIAKPGGGFGGATTFAGSDHLASFSANDHGTLLVVWENRDGQLFAAAGSATDGRFAPARELSTKAVALNSVTSVVTARGEGLVAWSRADRTFVARTGG